MIPFLISAMVLIAAVILLRQLFKNRISRRLQYALWLIVVIRLVLPVQLGTSPVSIDHSVPVKQVESAVKDTIREPVSGPSYTIIYTQVADEYVSAGQNIQMPEIQTQVHKETVQRITAPTFGEIANTVWLVGAILMGLWFAFVNLRFSHTLRKFSAEITVADCPIPVKVCGKLQSPCLSGIFLPTVYLTENCTDDPQRLRHILAHELTHLRHGDLLWSAVRSVLLCFYWFHPLVWAAAILSKRDCELACDEGALKRLGEDQRIAYGKTLLDTVARTPSPHHLMETATSMNETKKQLKERVNFIVKKPKFYLILTVCVLLIAAVATACTFTGAPDPTITPTEPTETTTMPTEPTVLPTTEPDPVAVWYTGTDTTPLSYEEYFSKTRNYSYKNISNTLAWTGPDGSTYSLSAVDEQALCIVDEAQQVLWAVPETTVPDGIQWLVCNGQWVYGITTTDILRVELQSGEMETLFTGEKLLCGDTGYKAANLMVCDRSFLLFAAVKEGKGCIFRLYLPTMTLDTLCDEIPADTLPCWLEIWMPENNRYYPFMYLNPQLQPIVYETLADPDSPFKEVIEAWPDSVEEPIIVDMGQAWNIPNLMTTYEYQASLEWLIISLQSVHEIPASVLWVYDNQEDAIIKKTDMLHTGNGGVHSVQTYPEMYPDIPLGITPEQLLAQLDAIYFMLDMPDYDEYVFPEEVDNPIKDGRTYNLTDLSFSYYTLYQRQCFTFSFEGKLQSISSWDEELPTAEGLKTGDSIKRMQQIYGTDYQKDVEGHSVYQYRVENGYLNVFYENDRVKGWSLTVYPHINND